MKNLRSIQLHENTSLFTLLQCCACYGPKGGRNNYCANTCIAVNGGNVTQQAFVWFWIRTRTPKRVWKRCMEFKKKRDDGKLETYFVDERAGTTHMVLF